MLPLLPACIALATIVTTPTVGRLAAGTSAGSEVVIFTPSWVLLLKMVDKSTSSLQTHFGPVFGDEAVQIGHLTLK